MAGTCQRQRNGRDQCPNFRATLDLRSFIVLILGSGFTPLACSLINGLLITVAFPTCARTSETSGTSFVTFLMSYPLQRLVAVRDQVLGRLTCTFHSLSEILSDGILFCAEGVGTLCLKRIVGGLYPYEWQLAIKLYEATCEWETYPQHTKRCGGQGPKPSFRGP